MLVSVRRTLTASSRQRRGRRRGEIINPTTSEDVGLRSGSSFSLKPERVVATSAILFQCLNNICQYSLKTCSLPDGMETGSLRYAAYAGEHSLQIGILNLNRSLSASFARLCMRNKLQLGVLQGLLSKVGVVQESDRQDFANQTRIVWTGVH